MELEYKSYTGSYYYSEDSGYFYGKVEGIEELVDFQAESLPELKDAFKEAVNYYLESLKK